MTARISRLATASTMASMLFALATSTANASCGAAGCTLMTDRFALDSGTGRGGLSMDLRYEDIDQDELRTGTAAANADDTVGEEALEKRTRQQGFIATLDYSFDPRWSVLLRVPMLRREHDHVALDEDTGAPIGAERWRYTEIGDVQLLARRRFEGAHGATAFAAYAGMELPTGGQDQQNSEGQRAERTLQPGSGTTDLLAGVSVRHQLGLHDSLFGQLGAQAALGAHDHFEPGHRISAAAGWSHALNRRFGTVLQLNYAWRDRDEGSAAEPDNSGATTLDLSPGFTLAVGRSSTLYAYVQVPLYQDVDGVQLMPDRSVAAGWTRDF